MEFGKSGFPTGSGGRLVTGRVDRSPREFASLPDIEGQEQAGFHAFSPPLHMLVRAVKVSYLWVQHPQMYVDQLTIKQSRASSICLHPFVWVFRLHR